MSAESGEPPVDELPPGPGAPGWWQLARFAHEPLAMIDEGHRRFGDAFTLRTSGFPPMVMLADPEAVRDVFRGGPEALHSGEANALFRATVGASSVLVLDEAPHARQRRVLVPPLKGERMRAFFEAMRSETLEAVEGWPVGRAFPTLETMRRITLRVILRAGLGLEAGPVLDEFERKVEAVLANGRQRHALVMMVVVPIERLSGSRWVPLFRQIRALDDALYALIGERRRGQSRAAGGNVLDDLLAARHEDGSPLADTEARDAIFTILVAGHETTALATSWALAELAARPAIVDRLIDELRRVSGGGTPEADQLAALEYLDLAIREALRLLPVVPFVVRRVKQPFTAGGQTYPAGVTLAPCSYLVHRREELYPEPEAFRPERFLDRKYGPQEWFPFGGGNRICLGMPFALYEMKVVLATLLARVRPARPPGARSRARRYGIVLGPDDGGRILVRPTGAG
jgi:cytochrome P450